MAVCILHKACANSLVSCRLLTHARALSGEELAPRWHQVILELAMNSLQDSLLHTEAPQTLVSTSATDSGGSNPPDEELRTLFEQPESSCRPRSCERGGRPFPYTRSTTRWRKRPNHELIHLRRQVIALEELVQVLALSTADSRARLLSTMKTRGSNVQAETLRRLRQETRRDKLEAALVENRALRAKLAGQFQVKKALERAVDVHMRLKARKLPYPELPDKSVSSALMNEELEQQQTTRTIAKVNSDSDIISRGSLYKMKTERHFKSP